MDKHIQRFGDVEADASLHERDRRTEFGSDGPMGNSVMLAS